MLGRGVLACAAVLVCAAVVVVAYPINTLRCCNTLVRPDNRDECMSKIGRAAICTQTRNLVCILERIPGFTESDCGKTDSGDFGTWQNFQPNDGTYSSFPLWPFRWDETHQECVYRKCAEQCPNGDINPGGEVNGVTMFEYQAKLYERRWYCCNDRPLCNSSRSTVGFNGSAIMVVVAIVACFLSFSSSWLY